MHERIQFNIRAGLLQLIIGLLLLAFPDAALAQTGKISGRIIDTESGEPLPGANVIIDETTNGASADLEGYYFILNVPPGEYSVTATFIGYEATTTTNVEVSVGKTTTIDFSMRPAVIEGAAVVVTAERPLVQVDRTSTEQFVSEETIARAPIQSIEEAMELQSGVHQGRFRGGGATEVVYLMDNVNLNSGLISDNYTGINLSSIEEISVLTGGYNAEYGNAQSAIINVITKEASATQIGGSVIGRMRPAGKYHFGRNFYSRDNYEWTNFDLDYWREQSQDENSEFFGEDPQSLLNRWHEQITPNDTLGGYTDRPEYETEMTFYGPLTSRLGFLVSGRYKRGVDIFPQVTPYNPEFNFQAKLSYDLTDRITLKLSGLYGGSESVVGSSNYSSTELSQEMEWTGPMQVTDPYAYNKYALPGSWQSWPRLRRVRNLNLEWNHVLNNSTIYTVQASYLTDKIDASDRDNRVPPDIWGVDADEYMMVEQFLERGYMHLSDNLNSTVLTLGGHVLSQVTRNHQVKIGGDVRLFSLDYEHAMMAFEGGERWNLMNIFDGKPYEGNLYAQDKIEFGGLVVNAGLRLDFFHQNREAAANMFDPLAFEETTDGNVSPGLPGDPEMVPTELQVALAPRLGFSHPITENSVLHFYYGHFYQRPSWNKMFGFPYISFAENTEAALDPFSGVETYMDQWQGYFGNPELGFEKTVQYEIGFNHNLAERALFSLTGYYKDASRQSGSWTWLYNATNQYNIPIMVANAGFADSRGVEFRVDSRLDFPLNFMLSYAISYNSGGEIGFNSLYELGSGVDSPRGYGQTQYPWSRQNRVKGMANLLLPEDFGPSLLGSEPLQNITASAYTEWWEGPEYTYHAAGDPSTEPNNMRWEGHYRTNLKLQKAFHIAGLRTGLSMEVRNVFNNKDLNMLGGDDLIRYHERAGQPLEERLPPHSWSEEPNRWGWYNIWTNPPRQVYFELRVDF